MRGWRGCRDIPFHELNADSVISASGCSSLQPAGRLSERSDVMSLQKQSLAASAQSQCSRRYPWLMAKFLPVACTFHSARKRCLASFVHVCVLKGPAA
jgi:hypothetical protein